MNPVNSDLKRTIIQGVIDKIHKKLPKNKAILVTEFIQTFYGTIALEDLATIEPADLYGAGLNLWQFIQVLAPSECKIRVYNPQFEQFGWQSTHTVIEIACKDMPFIVDSCSMELMRLGYNIHFIMHTGGLVVERNTKNEIVGFGQHLPGHVPPHQEAIIHFQIDRQTDVKSLELIEQKIRAILLDVLFAVEDWHPMQERMRQCILDLESIATFFDREECHETKAFLSWLLENHFTFLGYREYNLVEKNGKKYIETLHDANLGVLKNTRQNKPAKPIDSLSIEAQQELQAKKLITVAKSNTIATVHRPVYTDHISIKKYNAKGEPVGEKRFIGLYTSTAYNASSRTIPLLRHKVSQVMHKSGLVPTGHAAKALVNILETLPRDDLFQASVDELYDLCLAIYHLHERKRIRLFVRKDVFGHYYSCLVYVPRERYTSELRVAFQRILMSAFHGLSATAQTYFTESTLARLHFIIRVDVHKEVVIDFKALENALIEAGRNWIDDVKQAIVEYFGEENGTTIANEFAVAFPSSYREVYSPRAAVHDIEKCLKITAEHPLALSVYQFLDEDSKIIHFKVLQRNETLMLSDALPIFENLGMKVINEQSYNLNINENTTYAINDFSMQVVGDKKFKIDRVQAKLCDVFAAVCLGEAENDGFNQLVSLAEFNWQEVVVLRAYAKYMKQMGISFSQSYIEDALNENASIAKDLIEIFFIRFDPTKRAKDNDEKASIIQARIAKALEDVASLDQDRIICLFLQLILATLRTNFFQRDHDKFKSYISFKFDPSLISDLPLPKPLFEIFVYSPRFEGVHLRGGKVARGGIRWSDRREDFRTEVLGLMKAQQVKNAVIVPQGAKGGFYPKLIASAATREQVMAEGIACYQQFIRGLLDITDNLVNSKPVPPNNVVCYDMADPYLVVAADKGTATFSDIANEISEEYQFWLGDAFASGGSAGYDHKKMGITARGAWESVKCHFRALEIDFKQQPFSVIGIGDMSGDVFGNGLLQSNQIHLIGAFNHQHIFIDPNPDGEISFNERVRLFALPRSTWEDYNPELISPGGGIFKRSAKSIKMTPEMKERFHLTVDSLAPNDFIKILLMMDVDLLWNGGIGTYIKASYELDINVGDRTNDAVRVSAVDVRAKVIAEGGNLGLTQLARVEYALNGGTSFTDFIDNSAGVDCSDHEVNVKILLNALVAKGALTLHDRNKLLAEMTDEIAKLVLYDNYCQTKAINKAVDTIHYNINIYMRYLDSLEQQGLINRALEFLPDEKTILSRLPLGKSLTRPEIAVMFAYSKNILKKTLAQSNIIADPEIANMLNEAFPRQINEKYHDALQHHSLRSEIIATQLSNTLVNDMGLVFIPRMQEESGSDVVSIVRAYMIVRRSLNLRCLIEKIDDLDDKICSATKTEILLILNRMVRRATRWLLKQRRHKLAIDANVNYFAAPLTSFQHFVPVIVTGNMKETVQKTYHKLLEQNVPEKTAREVSTYPAMFAILDIIDGALSHKIPLEKFAVTYFELGEELSIDWLRDELAKIKSENRWEMLSRAEFRDELDTLQRQLTITVLSNTTVEPHEAIQNWLTAHKADIPLWQKELGEVQSLGISYTNIYIVLRALSMLVNLP